MEVIEGLESDAGRSGTDGGAEEDDEGRVVEDATAVVVVAIVDDEGGGIDAKGAAVAVPRSHGFGGDAIVVGNKTAWERDCKDGYVRRIHANCLSL